MFTEELQYTEHLASGERPKILIVEDDVDIAEMLQDHLEYSMSAETTLAYSAEQAIELDLIDPAEILIIDYMLPDTDGVELIKSLNGNDVRPAIFITGHATLGRAINAMRCGAIDMFVKPFDLQTITTKIAQAVEAYRHQQLRFKRLQKVRSLSKQVIKDRRQMRRKLDLVCRDVVSSYRDLAVKTATLAESQSGQA